jgi:cullin-4
MWSKLAFCSRDSDIDGEIIDSNEIQPTSLNFPKSTAPQQCVSMHKSNRASARREESTDSEKKRKRSSAATTSSSTAKQQTISELFSTNQQRVPQVTKPIDTPDHVTDKNSITTASPKSKRQKLQQIASSPPPRDALPPESMYCFPSRNKGNGAVVDLTNSPTGSPSPRRVTKAFAQSNYNPHLGAKKIVVKNLRTAPRSDPNQYLDQTWKKLDVSLDAIFGNQDIPFSLEELYRGVENVCRQGHAAELCKRLEEKAKSYSVASVKGGPWVNMDMGSVDILRAVAAAWLVWNKQMVCGPVEQPGHESL